MAETYPVQIESRLCEALKQISVADELPDDLAVSVTPATNPQFGDYQANVAMVLAKRLKTNPRELAAAIVEQFDGGDLLETPTVEGPGFINFRLKGEALEENVRDLLADPERLGVSEAADPKTIVIDFSAPNVAKPMHVGHIRSTIIGDSLARIARFLGNTVISDNHIGDWGTQFGMILWGWKNLLDQAAFEKDPVAPPPTRADAR